MVCEREGGEKRWTVVVGHLSDYECGARRDACDDVLADGTRGAVRSAGGWRVDFGNPRQFCANCTK